MNIFSTFYSTITVRVLRVLAIFTILEGGDAFVLGHFTTTTSVSLCSFDFASPAEWDTFYQKTIETENEKIASKAATEWHSSVPLDDIALTVPPNCKCLVIGCGNSYLPDRILQRENPPQSLVLLDTSPACLDQLRDRFQNTMEIVDDDNSIGRLSSSEYSNDASSTKIEYICGDVTQLSKYFVAVDNTDNEDSYNGGKVVDEDQDRHNNVKKELVLFDIIVDKGLTDAILCGEGWDGPLEKLLYESAKVLSMGTGQYLLISYKLPSSTKEFLVTVGKSIGLEWDFDFNLPSTTVASEKCDRKPDGRVSVAMARRNNKVIR